MKKVMLVGYPHTDIRGYLRVRKILEYHKPELVTIEGNSPGKKIREIINEFVETYSCKFPFAVYCNIDGFLIQDSVFVPLACEELGIEYVFIEPENKEIGERFCFDEIESNVEEILQKDEEFAKNFGSPPYLPKLELKYQPLVEKAYDPKNLTPERRKEIEITLNALRGVDPEKLEKLENEFFEVEFYLQREKRMAERIKKIKPDIHFGGLAHLFPEEVMEEDIYKEIKEYTLPSLLSQNFKIERIKLRDAEKL